MKIIKGISLLEMMLSLSLSTMIIVMISAILIAIQKNTDAQSELIAMQATMRIASDQLKTSLQQSGEFGCGHLSANIKFVNDTDYPFLPSNKLVITHELESDKVESRYASKKNVLINHIALNQDELLVASQIVFHSNDVVIITDCAQAEMVNIKKVFTKQGQQLLQLAKPLKLKFKKNSQLSKFYLTQFFISKTPFKHNDGSAIYSLYKKEFSQKKLEVASEVVKIKAELNNHCLTIKLFVKTASNWLSQKAFYIYIPIRG